MNTISSEKSLIKWPQNINGSNISTADSLLLKPFYKNVFDRLAKYAEAIVTKVNFIEAWHMICNDECDSVDKLIFSMSHEEESVRRVVNKFRGNLGEILAEKIFTTFGANWDVQPASYITVDPQNEMFIDAKATHIADRLPIGIQVKNYTVYSKTKQNPVKWDTFAKSMAMNSYWCADLQLIEPANLYQFFRVQRQYIFSFTNADNDKIVTDYAGSVKFIGPNEIEKLGLKSKAYIFQQIADEIGLFS